MTTTTKYEQDIFEYVLASYSFILPFTGYFTMQYWAYKIIEGFEPNPKLEEVLQVILSNNSKYILFRNQGNTSTIEINKGE